jgi:hypothetical protein
VSDLTAEYRCYVSQATDFLQQQLGELLAEIEQEAGADKEQTLLALLCSLRNIDQAIYNKICASLNERAVQQLESVRRCVTALQDLLPVIEEHLNSWRQAATSLVADMHASQQRPRNIFRTGVSRWQRGGSKSDNQQRLSGASTHKQANTVKQDSLA